VPLYINRAEPSTTPKNEKSKHQKPNFKQISMPQIQKSKQKIRYHFTRSIIARSSGFA
jgi:hypothetical protein